VTPNKYRVIFEMYGSDDCLHDRIVSVLAYTAEDACTQVRVQFTGRSFRGSPGAGMRDDFRGIRLVEPEAQP
jgi:hypothetical protein